MLVSFLATPLLHISSFSVQSQRKMLPWIRPGCHRDHLHHCKALKGLVVVVVVVVVAVTTDFELVELER